MLTFFWGFIVCYPYLTFIPHSPPDNHSNCVSIFYISSGNIFSAYFLFYISNDFLYISNIFSPNNWYAVKIYPYFCVQIYYYYFQMQNCTHTLYHYIFFQYIPTLQKYVILNIRLNIHYGRVWDFWKVMCLKTQLLVVGYAYTMDPKNGSITFKRVILVSTIRSRTKILL